MLNLAATITAHRPYMTIVTWNILIVNRFGEIFWKKPYRVGGKNKQRTNRARCGSTGANAPGSVNFLSAGAVTLNKSRNDALRNDGKMTEGV